MAEQDQSRTEQATPYKLDEARKKGTVAKSSEFAFAALLAVAVCYLFFGAGAALTRMFQGMGAVLGNAQDFGADLGAAVPLAAALGAQSLRAFAPFFVALLGVGVLVNLLQNGPVFSFHPIKPDLQRINPVDGFKKIWSERLILEAFKALAKIALVGAVIWLAISADLPAMRRLSLTPAVAYLPFGLDLVAQMVLKLLWVIAFLGVVDLVHRRWEFGKEMRMSHREIKDEVKQREGDPRIRARHRELRNELLKRSAGMSRVKDADVLITNPRRLAIALRYAAKQLGAPEVLAKGAGELAAHMRELAFHHNVPIVENRGLAQQLFRLVGVGQVIPEALYGPMARILARVYAARGQRANGAQPQGAPA